MFIKATKSKNYHYLQIVESYRENGKIKHRTIANLGRFDELKNNKQLLNMANRLLKLSGQSPVIPTRIEMEEKARLYYGQIIYEKIWKVFKLDVFLKKISEKYKITYDLNQIVQYLSIHRLMLAGSKHQAFESSNQFMGNYHMISLQHIYRCLDVLAKEKENIEEKLFEQHRDLFNMEVDVVFYDLTTIHFESNKADELRDFGFSKAGKFNEVQVVLGLLIDKEGRPIGYELFEGDMSEISTVVKVLQSLQNRFKIGKLIFVADRGLNSGKNLALIRSLGYHYIVACKLKSQPKSVIDSIFHLKDYKISEIDKETGEILFKYKIDKNHEFKYKDEQNQNQVLKDNLLLSWSAKRAAADRKKRQRLIDKAEQMVEEKTTINSKRGAKKYIATQGKEKSIGLNQSKIEQDAKWDGYYGIQFSEQNVDYQYVMNAYRMLWKIEESFRTLKSTMKIRPVFHWTPQRIKGHFMLCFISFLIERHLEWKLRKNNVENISPQSIKNAINSLQVSKISLNDEQYFLKGKHLPLAAKILRIFKIKQPKNLTPIDEFDLI